MLMELRKVAKRNKKKAAYIRQMQYRGLIRKYINEKGYVCYDVDEYKQFRKTRKMGRPIKGEEGNE